jgi:hypothetical protein
MSLLCGSFLEQLFDKTTQKATRIDPKRKKATTRGSGFFLNQAGCFVLF